ncbi:hypothetical protein [Meiothermus sp.]|uniref:hypothetical protein n=1 Tax=Meiothermus sp. TaxID=1955249 RepID=UPI0021DCC809|nr:hypothetical protein [Meiothermus sp.]GIW33896.1 MAG: hypothetical protein KatS3mg072_1229 [Meiothermus sp.]
MIMGICKEKRLRDAAIAAYRAEALQAGEAWYKSVAYEELRRIFGEEWLGLGYFRLVEICSAREVTVEVDGELFSVAEVSRAPGEALAVVVRHLPSGRAVGSLAQLGEVFLSQS